MRGEDAVPRIAGIGPERPHPAHQHRHFRDSEAERVRLVDQRFSRTEIGPCRIVVAEPVGLRLEEGEGGDIGLRLQSIDAARCERHGHTLPGALCRLLDSGVATQNDQVGQRHLLAVRAAFVEVGLDAGVGRQHLLQLRGIVDRPIALRVESDASAIGAATSIGVAIG